MISAVYNGFNLGNADYLYTQFNSALPIRIEIYGLHCGGEKGVEKRESAGRKAAADGDKWIG